MDEVTGVVVLHATGRAIEGMTITVVDVEEGANEQFLKGTLTGKSASAIQELSVHRLGSAVTDAAGRFAIAYTPRDAAARPTLGLVVLGPETPGDHSCPRILHASCDLRVGAAQREEFRLALTPEALRRGGALAPRWAHATPGQAVLSEVLEEVKRRWFEETPDPPLLSEVYLNRHKEMKPPQPPMPDRGFLMGMRARNEQGKPVSLAFKEGNWVVRRRGQDVPVAFKGVDMATELASNAGPWTGLGAIVDSEAGSFRMVVPEPVYGLKEREDAAGQLDMMRIKLSRVERA
jgi:hypothetical protein